MYILHHPFQNDQHFKIDLKRDYSGGRIKNDLYFDTVHETDSNLTHEGTELI